MTPLACAVGGYAAWTVANDFLNAPYTVAAIFDPAFLFAGFVLARRRQANSRAGCGAAVLAGVSVLAGWALWQAASGEGRAHAHFETPNTLATVINLALAPLLFRLLHGEASRTRFGLALLLSACLISTLSRGGMIALAGGLVVASLLFGRTPAAASVARFVAALGGGAAAVVLAIQAPAWLPWHGVPEQAHLQAVTSTLSSTLGSRRELYELALSAAGDHPWLGSGYLAFNALLERQRAQVPSYPGANFTYFVHNDYLQTLVELGVPGLMALLAVVVLPFCSVRKSPGSGTDPIGLYAALAGLATMAIHALGDFPFYVPLCLFLFGNLLGDVDRLLAAQVGSTPCVGARQAVLARIATVVMTALLLIPPALADAAAAYGERTWSAGNGKQAAWGFEAARRLQPRDWRYHWYAAQFWSTQALQLDNRAAAQLADEAFAAAAKANPNDPRPLLGRASAQLHFARLLDRPQPRATLRGWVERALSLAPLNPSVRQDYATAMRQLRDGQ